VVPVKDHEHRVFGVLAVDTVNDQRNRSHATGSTFTPSDIAFYQVPATYCVENLPKYILGCHLPVYRISYSSSQGGSQTHVSLITVMIFCLQCYDAVGWAAGRASGLEKTEWWGAGMVICLQRGADLLMAQLLPMPLTVSCSSQIQIGFTFLVPAHPGSPGQRAVKRVCVCVCACVRVCNVLFLTNLHSPSKLNTVT